MDECLPFIKAHVPRVGGGSGYIACSCGWRESRHFPDPNDWIDHLRIAQRLDPFSGPDCGVDGCAREVGHIGDHRPAPAPVAGLLLQQRDEAHALGYREGYRAGWNAALHHRCDAFLDEALNSGDGSYKP